jgi:hypothetical protein
MRWFCSTWSLAGGLGLAVCALLAVSCGSKSNGRGQATGGAGGGLATGGAARGTGGGLATGGAAQGTGGSLGTGGAAQGTGGSLGTGGAAQGTGGSPGTGGSLGAGTGGLAGGTSGSPGLGTGGGSALSTGGNQGPGLDSGIDAIACSPGVDPADCQLCQRDLPASCERACPKVDCSVYPPPAECEAVCAGGKCCECRSSVGREYTWQQPQPAITCGTQCDDLVARWKALVSPASLTTCAVDADCVVVGGSGSCNCASAISGCGKAVNRAAYQASGASDLELTFNQSCPNAARVCDCGLPSAGCSSGQCVLTGYRGCSIPPDSGPPRG